MDMINPGTYWWYKDKQYVVLALREDMLSQDALGDWVPTVVYTLPNHRALSFCRPWTEFMSKFGFKS
jgi:hypothetical protein